MVSGVYALAQQREKESFWNHLLELNHVVELPWCLIGDFNELANPSEKKGGQRYPITKFERLNKFMNNIDGVFVQSTGYVYTWKKKIRTHLIYGRLDRAIARNDWLSLYPDSTVTHGNFSCLDHRPIILSVSNLLSRHKIFPFRFQNFWCQYRQLDTIVGKQWRSPVQGTKMYRLSQKLKFTKHKLKDWSRTFIGNTHQKLILNSQKLELVEEKLSNQPESCRLKCLIIG